MLKTSMLKNHVFDHETHRLKINDFLSSYIQISKSTFSHPCNKFLATTKVGFAHCNSFRGGESHIVLSYSTYMHCAQYIKAGTADCLPKPLLFFKAQMGYLGFYTVLGFIFSFIPVQSSSFFSTDLLSFFPVHTYNLKNYP